MSKKNNDAFNYKKLRKLRRFLDISLDQIAFETGVSIGYISRLERGFITEIKNRIKRIKIQGVINDLEIDVKKKYEAEYIGKEA